MSIHPASLAAATGLLFGLAAACLYRAARILADLTGGA